MEGTPSKFRLKDILPEGEYLDKKELNSFKVEEEHYKILEKARNYYEELTTVVNEYIRNRKFLTGDQWSDVISNPGDGKPIAEKQLILNQGRQPIVNNQIQQIVKNILGQYRDNDYKPIVQSRIKQKAGTSEMMSNALHYVYDTEELKEVDTRAFNSYLLSALPGWKVDYGYNPDRNKNTIKVTPINPQRIFFNTDIEDVRLRDLTMIGEIIDMPLDDIVAAFAKGDAEREKQIRSMFNETESHAYAPTWDPDIMDARSFYTPFDSDKNRIYEIWMKKTKTKVICHDFMDGHDYQHPMDSVEAWQMIQIENEQRIIAYMEQGIPIDDVPLIEAEERPEEVWCYYYMSPYGHVLDSGETPFIHESHPYVLRPYPLMDRQLIPFASTMIDQQKYINRIIIMLDFMMGAGAKGVLAVPEEMIPPGMTEDEFAEKWVKFNSVIFYKAKDAPPNARIEQFYSNSQNVAGENMLSLQLQLIKEISGVTEAIQGQRPAAGTPSSLYAQMANYASLSSKDYFEHFFNAKRIRDRKIVSLIQQYWDHPMYINVSGSDYDNEAYMYDPEKAADGEYDIVIGKSGNSPMYRSMMDDYLYNFTINGMIDPETFLENTSLPFAQKLLQEIKSKRNKAEQMQAIANNPEAIQAMGQADPQIQGMFNQAMGK